LIYELFIKLCWLWLTLGLLNLCYRDSSYWNYWFSKSFYWLDIIRSYSY